MAVSSIKDFWIHPNALTITLNYFGDPQLIQTSMLAGAVIMAYRKDVISYDAAHNFREWKLQAFPTQLNDTCAYYVHAELSRSGDTAMIIYSPVKRDIEGRSFIDGAWDSTTSSSSWFIYLGTISASVDNDGATVERAWTDGFYTGTLDTDQQRMEEASGEWKTMFNYNAVTDQIEPLKPFSKIKVMGEAIFQSIAQFVNGLVIGERTITDVAASSDSGNESKVSDATLPTTGYVAKEIEALDDHFLVKDGTEAQTVGGDVTFTDDVDVKGDHAVEGSQAISGNQTIGGKQTLHEGFQTEVFSNIAGQITGAQLTKQGILTVAGLQAMTFEVFELIYNLIKAQGGKATYSDTATIESCMYALDEAETNLVSPDDFYNNNKGAIGSSWTNAMNSIDHVILTLKKTEDNKGLVPFKNGDFLYGYVNQIGESGQYSRGGQSIMHVTTPDNQIGEGGSMVIRAVLELIGDAVANPNYVTTNMPPTESMVVAHRGNINGTEGRTTSFFIDSEAGNIIMLQNVTTPTITDGNYAIVNGLLPDDLLAKVQAKYPFVNKHTPVNYARFGIFENVLEFDHQGNIIQRENNRGAWNENTAKNPDFTKRYKNEPNYYDVVTYDGSTWKCLSSDQVDVPGTNNLVWLQLVAKGDNGTSIKVKGEKPSVGELPVPPADPSYCYIVGQDLYVWLPDENKWYNAGQFKGDKGDKQYIHIAYANSADGSVDFSTSIAAGRTYVGTCVTDYEKDPEYEDRGLYKWMYNKGEQGGKGDDAVTLDLSNDMDSMLYSADGTKLTSEVKTTASLRVGKTVNPIDVEWVSPTASGCTVEQSNNVYTVTDLSANDASVTIKANYNGETYERVFTIKKIVGQAKYEVLCTPNSLTYNETTTVISSEYVNVYIYKTEQNSSGGLERKIVATLPDKYELKVNGTKVTYAAGNHKITPSSDASEYVVELFDNNAVLQDTETVSLTKVSDGNGIEDEVTKYGKSSSLSEEPKEWFDTAEETGVKEGEYLWTRTTTTYNNEMVPNVTDSISYQGKDNTSVQYELRTNVNIIYIHDRENASKQSINLVVGKTTSKGYVEFTDSDSLLEEGFEIQYNYDSQGERKTLEYGQTGIMLEDGSMLIGEDGSSMVYEFTVEDITSIKDHIMFYLHEIATGKDWAAREVDVVRDGDGALTVEVDAPIIILPVDANGENVLTGFSNKTISVRVKKGGVLQSISDYTISVKDNEDNKFEVSNQVLLNKWTFHVSVKKGAQASSLKHIEVTINGKNSKGETISATSYIYYQHSRSGMAGPMGVAGPSYYPAGEYDATEKYEYTYKKDAEGNLVLDKNGNKIISAIPFVWYDPNQNGEGQYYVLNTESIQGIDPATGYNDGKKWDWFQKTKFIFTEALMARWAQLAKAVFYGDYMFSVDGVASNGSESDYSQHQKKDLMFDNKEKLTGNFVPNLFLDFVAGSAKFGKLSESFINYPDNSDGVYSYKKEIAFDSCHNIAHYPIVGNNACPNVVILPKVENEGFWVEDGSHCTIMHKFSMDYTLQPTNYRNAALVVCADDILFTPASDYGSNDTDWMNRYKANGWMVWKGRRVKFVFLAPGSVLKLRSFKDATTDNILWYIENASDFVVLETRINAYGDYNKDSYIPIDSSDSVSHEGDSGLCPIIGSEQFNWFDSHKDNIRTEWRINANGDVNDPNEGRIPLITHIDL